MKSAGSGFLGRKPRKSLRCFYRHLQENPGSVYTNWETALALNDFGNFEVGSVGIGSAGKNPVTVQGGRYFVRAQVER
jgi:hypothetical protein